MAAEDNKEEKPLGVIEVEGGAAEITLDESAGSTATGIRDDNQQGAPTGDVGSDDQPSAQEQQAEDAEVQAAKSEEEREQIRARRRQERRDKRDRARQREASKDRQIEELKGQVTELTNWRGTVEHRSFVNQMSQIDNGIAQAREAEKEAKEAIQEAMASQNGAAMAEAQDVLYEAKKRIEILESAKGRLEAVAQRMSTGGAPRGGDGQRQQRRPQIDPDVQRLGGEWMKRHSWYDPNGGNQDSRVALSIDTQLHDEGFDPKTPEYWAELDNRLKSYMPHRYTGYNAQQRQTGQGGGGGVEARPGVTTAGPGRSAGGARSTKFTLSADRVQAIKDAGLWEDPAKRDKMIRQYREFDLRNNKS